MSAARAASMRASAAAAVIVGLLACSPAVVDAPPGPDAATSDAKTPVGAEASTTAAFCTSYAYARCSYLQTCSSTAVQNRYGTIAVCEAVFAGLCENSQNAPSTGATQASATACENTLTNTATGWTCSNYLYGESIPPPCQTAPGSRPIGAACGVAQQCQTGYCALPLYGACGTCAPVPAAGASCAQFICPPTLTCVAGTETCVAFAQEGASCSAAQPCSDGLTCVVASGTTGTCEPGSDAMNEACSFTGAGCNFYDGLTCNVETGLCATATLGAPGQACGVVGEQAASCLGGTCLRGACVAYPLPGQPCDTVSGPPCIADARCIVSADGGTTGTCELNGFAACP